MTKTYIMPNINNSSSILYTSLDGQQLIFLYLLYSAAV